MRALAFALGVVALVTSCSTTDAVIDAGYDATDGLACAPIDFGDAADASAYVPAAMNPPHPPHENACITQQISDYVACQTATDITKCSQFQKGNPSAACGACIESQITDPQWGVVVFNGTEGRFNMEGCVDDVLAQTPPNSCGQLLYWSYGCQDAVCSACTGDTLVYEDDSGDAEVVVNFDQCALAALTGECASWNAKVHDPAGFCASLFADANPADVSVCFPDPATTDPTQQESDWLTSIITFMCGP